MLNSPPFLLHTMQEYLIDIEVLKLKEDDTKQSVDPVISARTNHAISETDDIIVFDPSNM